MRIAGADRRGGRLGVGQLALGGVPVDLHVRQHAAGVVEALGGRGALRRVGHQPRARDRPAEQLAERGAVVEQPQPGEAAVVGEAPEHRRERLGVQDAVGRARGGAAVHARAARAERAAGEDPVVVEAIDDAQAVADAVLGVHALAAAGAEHAGHVALVEQRVALWERGVGGEQGGHHVEGSRTSVRPPISTRTPPAASVRRAGSPASSVRKRALRPRATALSTGASRYSP